MALTLTQPVQIQKTLDEAWIKHITLSGLPGGKYIAEVHLIPWNRQTNQYEERVDLQANPDMVFAVDIMQLLNKPKIKAAYDALVEAVGELHEEVKQQIAASQGNQ